MDRPSGRTRWVVTALCTPLWVATPAAAIRGPEVGADISPYGDVLTVVAVVLVFVAGWLKFAPAYATRVTDRVAREPARALLWGVGAALATAVVAGVLSITLVGVLVSGPLTTAAVALSMLGYLAVGRAVSASRLPALAVTVVLAVAVAALVVTLPVVGGPLAGVVGCLGIGGAVLDHKRRTVDKTDASVDVG